LGLQKKADTMGPLHSSSISRPLEEKNWRGGHKRKKAFAMHREVRGGRTFGKKPRGGRQYTERPFSGSGDRCRDVKRGRKKIGGLGNTRGRKT